MIIDPDKLGMSFIKFFAIQFVVLTIVVFLLNYIK